MTLSYTTDCRKRILLDTLTHFTDLNTNPQKERSGGEQETCDMNAPTGTFILSRYGIPRLEYIEQDN